MFRLYTEDDERTLRYYMFLNSDYGKLKLNNDVFDVINSDIASRLDEITAFLQSRFQQIDLFNFDECKQSNNALRKRLIKAYRNVVDRYIFKYYHATGCKFKPGNAEEYEKTANILESSLKEEINDA